MKVDGPGAKKKTTHAQEMKAIAFVMGKDIFEDVKMPRKKRMKETKKRKKYDRAEDRLRVNVLREYRRQGCTIYRIENGLPGYKGIPDLWVFNPRTGWGGWVELKTDKGVMSKHQLKFQDLCKKTNVNHVVLNETKFLKKTLYT